MTAPVSASIPRAGIHVTQLFTHGILTPRIWRGKVPASPGGPMPDTFDDYRQTAGVNWSTLKLLDKSPLHYRHAVEHPDDGDTAIRGMLRAVHALVLDDRKSTRLNSCHSQISYAV